MRAVRWAPMAYDRAFTFIEALDRLSSVDEVMDSMQRTLNSFGIEFFSFFSLPRQGQRFEEVSLSSRVPWEWQKIYLGRQYVHVSPAVRHCRRTVQPFVWKSAPYDPEREPRATEFVNLMTEFSLSNSISIPIPGPSGCEGCAWLGGERQELTASNMPMIHLVALYAFDRIRSVVNPRPSARPNLTPREREALTWVALGKSAWEIGEILHIAKRTVDEHTQTAMHKLGAANRTQAVAIALRERMIEP